MRISLGISYNGSQFHGWQRQVGLRTVQQELETALSKIAATPISIICAGRTDAGVHASGQVIHFDSDVNRNEFAWHRGTNSYLPADIAVQWIKPTTADFHARFSALSRTYQYRIFNHAIKPVFNQAYATWIPQPLDRHVMQEAGQYLLGEHDFSSFRASDCQSLTPMRNVQALTVSQNGVWLTIEIRANAFLHHMVRNIVGVLLTIGRQRRPAIWAQEVLEARDRKQAAATAPAQGLFLTQVEYPALYAIPKPVNDSLTQFMEAKT